METVKELVKGFRIFFRTLLHIVMMILLFMWAFWGEEFNLIETNDLIMVAIAMKDD